MTDVRWMRGIVRAVSNAVVQMEWLVQPERIDPCALGTNLTQGHRLRHQPALKVHPFSPKHTEDCSTRTFDTGAIEVATCMT